MAEELQDTVERLQSRLLENPDSRKLVKTLKRLGELPITVDILVETGVGKTVNSFRKHELAGGAAKDLVAKWKELVPQSSDRSSKSHAKEATRSHAHSRGSEANNYGYRLPEEEHSYRVEEDDREQEEEENAEMEEEEEEERGYHTNYLPSPPQQQHYSPQRLAHGSGLRGGYQSEGYESPEPEPEPEPSPPPRKEARHHVKPHKEPSKNHHQHSSHHGDHSKEKERLKDEDRRQRHAQTQGGERGGGTCDSGKGEGKKRSADGELHHGGAHKAAKHSRHSSQHDGKKERDKEEKKKGGSDGRPRVAPKDSPSKDSPPVKMEDLEEFETPTMSFESFLTYDAPAVIKKKKKPSSSSSSSHCRTSHTSSSSHHEHVPPPAASSSSSSSSKASKANGTKTSKKGESRSALATPPEKRKRVVEAVPSLPTLPDIPLPAIQPNYRPLPSIELTPLSPQRRKVPVSNDAEEDAGFTGKRASSKMSVYSGVKTAYLPKMMSLYEQCIRVLQNNIDSIDEVGGVPFEILEPVLERCTPDQLFRIEQCNQCFIEESDELWRRHCQRDFKRAAPQEYESWREVYLRYHEEREQRLLMLTQNISSAHANKPKGRTVKMAFVNSVAKPPRDVRRRQERFGTTSGSTASSTTAAAPIKVRPAVMYSSSNSSEQAPSSSSSQNSPPHSSSRSSLAPAGGAGPGGPAGAAARDNKPQVKKIAPMMAKTIKAFKNRFSRR